MISLQYKFISIGHLPEVFQKAITTGGFSAKMDLVGAPPPRLEHSGRKLGLEFFGAAKKV